MIDWDATVAWIAFAVAVITPCITTYLNNRFQLKLKAIEITQKSHDEYITKLTSVYTNYLETTAKLLLEHSYLEEYTAYSRAYHTMFLYVSEPLHKSLEQLDSMISNKNFNNESADLFLHITKMLSYELNTTKQKSK